jgi:chitobiase/beta-hexosaminidase-like protein
MWRRLTRGLLFTGLLLCLGKSAHAQSYSLPNNNNSCPASCRVIPWSTGSDIWNGGTLPNYTSVTCSPLAEDGVTDDSTNIQNCINAATAGTGAYSGCAPTCAVFLPAGTIYVNGTVRLKSGVVLRGAGPTTHINEGVGAFITTVNFSYHAGGQLDPGTDYNTLPSTYAISGTPQKGDTTVTITSGSPVIGSWIKIFGNDDPSLISNTLAAPAHCNWCADNDGFYLMQQIVHVTNKVGSVLTISPALYYPPDTTSRVVPGPDAIGTVTEPAGAKYNIITFPTQKAGFESFHVVATGDIGAKQILNLYGCLYCWVKRVETETTGANSGSSHLEIDESYGAEVRDNYFHDQRSGASGSGYGVYFQFINGDHKIENNIIRHSRHGIVYQGGGSGTAILYNYVDDQYTDDLSYVGSSRTSHGAHPFFNLFEGNIMSHLAADDCWGTSSHDVMFRNWFWGDYTGNWTVPSPGTDAPTPTGSNPINGYAAIDLYTGQTYYAFVGNILGHAGLHATWSGATVRTFNAFPLAATPVVYSYGGAAGTTGACNTIASSTAPSSDTTSINHGNWDYKTVGVAYWEGGSNHTLANSIYYNSVPAFMSAYPWPLLGPEGSPTTNTNAAENCYLAGPGIGGVFNPAACYANGGGNPAATPTFSPPGGTYAGPQNTTISTTTGGATLCYTTDGTTPTANGSGTCTHGAAFSTPIPVPSALTIKAISSQTGFTDSAVGAAAYVINAPIPVRPGNWILSKLFKERPDGKLSSAR